MTALRRFLLSSTTLCVGLMLFGRAAPVHLAPTAASLPSTACPTDLEEIGRLGGYTTAFTVSGGFAYIGIGSSVRIVDARPPFASSPPSAGEATELHEVSAISLAAEANHLAVTDGTLLVAADNERELQAFDVRDPTAPLLLGQLPFGDDIQALAVQWPVAFVGFRYRLLTVDVADPARMTVLSETPVPQLGIYHWMVLHDGLLFAPGSGMDASGGRLVHGLRVLDVRDPLSVRDLGAVEIDPRPYDLAFVGSVAYVAVNNSGVRTFDMSDPLDPKPLGSVETPRGGLHHIVSDGRFAYGLGDWGAVYVADVRDPTRPVHVKMVELPGEGLHLPALDGNRLSLASNGAIHLMDVADPPTVTLRAAFHTVGTSEGGIAVQDGRAYVGTVEGLRSIDVRDPRAARDDGGVLVPFPPSEVQVAGLRAYVAGGYFVCCGTVSILDLADAARPRTLGTVRITGNPYSMAVREPYLLVSSVDSDMPGPTRWGGVRLRLYDIADPAVPSDGVEIPHAGTLASVAGLTYVFDGELLRVLDIAADGAPISVSSQSFAHSINAVQVIGAHLYAAQSERLLVLDVSDPRSPVVLDEIEGIGGHAMAADGACLFAMRDQGTASDVQVVELDDPARPRLVDTVRGVGGMYGADGIAVDQGRVYLASHAQGLTILAPGGSPRPTASPTTPRPTATPWAHRLAMPWVALAASDSHLPGR